MLGLGLQHTNWCGENTIQPVTASLHVAPLSFPMHMGMSLHDVLVNHDQSCRFSSGRKATSLPLLTRGRPQETLKF